MMRSLRIKYFTYFIIAQLLFQQFTYAGNDIHLSPQTQIKQRNSEISLHDYLENNYKFIKDHVNITAINDVNIITYIFQFKS